MSADRMRDDVISFNQGNKFLQKLVKAGLTSTIAQEVIVSRDNKKAEAMMAVVNDQKVLVVEEKKPEDPFKFLTEFEVIVPPGYVHDTCLNTFKQEHEKEFYYFNPAATDENFAKATTKLAPGRKFKVKVFGIAKSASSEQCLAKVRDEHGILLGAQGLTLAYLQGKAKLPKGKWHLSFDEKEALPYLGGDHRVPDVSAYSDGDFGFDLDGFGGDWGQGCCLLVFCDSE